MLIRLQQGFLIGVENRFSMSSRASIAEQQQQQHHLLPSVHHRYYDQQERTTTTRRAARLPFFLRHHRSNPTAIHDAPDDDYYLHTLEWETDGQRQRVQTLLAWRRRFSWAAAASVLVMIAGEATRSLLFGGGSRHHRNNNYCRHNECSPGRVQGQQWSLAVALVGMVLFLLSFGFLRMAQRELDRLRNGIVVVDGNLHNSSDDSTT